MLTQNEFELWCERLKFSPETRVLVAGIRAAEPSRRVKSVAGNVSGRYPSRKIVGAETPTFTGSEHLDIYPNNVLFGYEKKKSIAFDVRPTSISRAALPGGAGSDQSRRGASAISRHA
jgi:hypothetical protein